MFELKNIEFTAGGQKILRGVDLQIKKGEFVVLTGPNGSGKSTLAKIMMGVLKQNRGKIFYNDKEISKCDVKTRADKGIAYAFQTPVKIRGVTVERLLRIASGETDDNSAKTDSYRKYLRDVGLEPSEYPDRDLGDELSGGERKRIEIASVLARNADLMIFDEPEAGIDLWSFDNLVQVFRRLHRQGKTLLVISHQERILKIADRVIIMRDGKIAKAGDWKDMGNTKGESGNE